MGTKFIRKTLLEITENLQREIELMKKENPELKAVKKPYPVICEKLDEIIKRSADNPEVLALAVECQQLAKTLKLSTVYSVYKKMNKEINKRTTG